MDTDGHEPIKDTTVVSPGKTNYWIPECEDAKKPYVGRTFPTLDEGVNYYQDYASLVGFDARHSTKHSAVDRTVRLKYMICTRAGYKAESTSTGQRTRFTNRVGCGAKVAFKFIGTVGYVVSSFEERHTHTMLTDAARQFLKSKRKLDFGHQKFIMSCAKSNLGASSAHRVYKDCVGGYGNVGPLASDFNNFKRGLMAYISNADAQMILDKFHHKKEMCSAFFFEYATDNTQQLTRLFWADPTSRKNFAAFGDVVAFYSTYKTNRYNLVFAPFTGMDNHKNYVTFAVGLLMNEDIQSYEWLFDCFKRAMTKDPTIFVTDQDPAMKVAIKAKFPNTRHRFCLWHITNKFTERIPSSRTDFPHLLSTLQKLFWNEGIEPNEFEKQWEDFIHDHDLQDNDWLGKMYRDRTYWIPAYFRDHLLASCVRCTSIAESQNSFFKTFCNRKFTLVELLMNIDSALDKQRHEQHKLNVESEMMVPKLKTPLKVEAHAAELYTNKLFLDTQKEIVDSLVCHVISTDEGDLLVTFNVKDGSNMLHLQHGLVDGYTKCSCKMFERIGIPCRHIWSVFNFMRLDRIPECMVLTRWRKDAYKLVGIDYGSLQQSAEVDEKKAMMSELWSSIHSSVGLVEDDKDLLRDFIHTLREKRECYMSSGDVDASDVSKKVRMVESFAGVAVPNDINVYPPAEATNKGSGKRFKGGKEKSIEDSHRRKRQCHTCHKYGHNSRTCKNIL